MTVIVLTIALFAFIVRITILILFVVAHPPDGGCQPEVGRGPGHRVDARAGALQAQVDRGAHQP